MGFKLIRLDSEEPSKISLKVGTHVIGRGSFLNCDDHRVSRKHGVIKVTESTILLKSLHQNPCFYNKKELKKTALLRQGKCITLSNTDHFGLLPDTYWYEIIFCDNNNQPNNPIPMDQEHNVNDNQDKNRENDTDLEEKTRELSGYNNSGTQEVTYQSECDEGSDSELLNLQFDETMEDNNGPESQSLITGDNQLCVSPPQDLNTNPTNEHTKSDETNETPCKRSHDPDSHKPKKVKTALTSSANETKELNTESHNTGKAGSTSPIYEDTDSQNTANHTDNVKDVTNMNETKKSNTDAESNYDKDTEPPSPSDVKDEPKNTDSESNCDVDTDPPSPYVKDEPKNPKKVKNNTDSESNNDVDTDPPSPHVKDEPKSPKKVKTELLSPKNNTDSESNNDVDTDPPSPHVKDEPKSPKKVKTELLSPKDEKNDATVKPGTSNDQAGSSNDGAAAPPAAPPARERCIYGASCYRRNVQHAAQFSHPRDADYGAGARGACPYGRACRRRDPRHWALHEHPPGVRPPQQQPGNRAKKPRRVVRTPSDSEDSDNSPQNLIVQGKRKRKPVKRESWSDSEEEFQDPYGTDESDEWVPSSDAHTSQSQGL